MIATTESIANEWIADQRHNDSTAIAAPRTDGRFGAWICFRKLVLSLTLSCLFAIAVVWLMMTCVRTMARSSPSPLDVVHRLAASR